MSKTPSLLLRDLRESRGFSVPQLSIRSGLSISTLESWEKTEPVMSPGDVAAVAEALSIEPVQLRQKILVWEPAPN